MSRRASFCLIISLLMLCIAQKAARFSTLDPDAFWHLNVAWLLLRDRRLGERSRAVWLIVPLTALLVNVHVFVIFVPAWIGALLVGSIIERKRIRRYALMLILSVLAFMCTPMLRGMIDAIAHLPVSDPMTAARQQQELQTLWFEPYGRFIAV